MNILLDTHIALWAITDHPKLPEKARELIPAGASVALGSGTTVYGLGLLLDDHPKGVIYSNSLQTADYLSTLNFNL